MKFSVSCLIDPTKAKMSRMVAFSDIYAVDRLGSYCVLGIMGSSRIEQLVLRDTSSTSGVRLYLCVIINGRLGYGIAFSLVISIWP